MKNIFAVITCSLLLFFSVAAEAGPKEEAATAELAKLGFPGVYVTKTSYGNYNHRFVAFTTKGCISADIRNRRAAVLENADEVVQKLRTQQNNPGDCVNILHFAVPNDTRDKDTEAGWWEGTTHHFHVYALYSIAKVGNIVDEGLFTASGAHPSHYHGYLYEKKNCELALNTLNELNFLIQNGDIAPADVMPEADYTSEEAMERIHTFYYNLNHKYYDEAYNMFSDDWKRQTGFEGWQAGFANTVSQEVKVLSCDRSSGVCRVYFELSAVDNVEGKPVHSLFAGHWDVFRENGRAVLGNPEIRKIK